MSKIAVIIDDWFEDVEYTQPAKAFEDAGHRVIKIGLSRGKRITGKRSGSKVTIDEAVKDVSAADYDALFIPGGYSPDRLRAHNEAVQFVKEFVESGKPVLAICHGPQLLISAESLQGRKVTCYKSVIQEIKNAGAIFVNRAVVEDGNLITSRDPRDIPPFIEASLKKLTQLTQAGVRNK